MTKAAKGSKSKAKANTSGNPASITDSGENIKGDNKKETQQSEHNSMSAVDSSPESSEDEISHRENDKKKKKNEQQVQDFHENAEGRGEETMELVTSMDGSTAHSPHSQVRNLVDPTVELLSSISVEMDQRRYDPAWATAWTISLDNICYEVKLAQPAELAAFFADKTNIADEDYKKLAELIDVQLYIPSSRNVRENTPDDNVSLLWSMTQVKWMSEDNFTISQAANWADFRNNGVRESMVQCIEEVATQCSEIAESMRQTAKKIQQGQEGVIDGSDMDKAWRVIPSVAGVNIAWFIEMDDKAILCSIQRKEQTQFKVKEALAAIQYAKICKSEQQYYVLGSPGNIKGSAREATIQQLRTWFSQYLVAITPKRIGGGRTRREIQLMSNEETKVATHVLISNIPIQFKAAKEAWLQDMIGAIKKGNELAFPFTLTDQQLSLGMQRIIESHDNGQTFGIIVTLQGGMQTGPTTMPVHFDLRGLQRDPMKGERPPKYGPSMPILTRYLFHMITKTEAEGLSTCRVQCVMRGCSTETCMNNFLRHVVTRYIAVEKRLSGRLAIVQIIRHNLAPRNRQPDWRNEAIIVVYALAKPSPEALDSAMKHSECVT
jgi:hypothetical protein